MALPDPQRWLTDHPKVLTFLFVAALYFGKGIDVLPNGLSEGYHGP